MTDEPHDESQESQPSTTRIVGLDPVLAEFRANREAQKRYERGKIRREWITIVLLILAALIYGGLLIVSFGQFKTLQG